MFLSFQLILANNFFNLKTVCKKGTQVLDLENSPSLVILCSYSREAFCSLVAVTWRSLLFTFPHSAERSGTIFEIIAACTEEHLSAEASAKSV